MIHSECLFVSYLVIFFHKAYAHGRTWLASNVRRLMDPNDVDRGDKLEEQTKLVLLWYLLCSCI